MALQARGQDRADQLARATERRDRARVQALERCADFKKLDEYEEPKFDPEAEQRVVDRYVFLPRTIDVFLAAEGALASPGDIGVGQLERIFGDVASLAWKWNKPLSARLQPVLGKKAGEQTDFNSQYLFNTTLHALP